MNSNQPDFTLIYVAVQFHCMYFIYSSTSWGPGSQMLLYRFPPTLVKHGLDTQIFESLETGRTWAMQISHLTFVDQASKQSIFLKMYIHGHLHTVDQGKSNKFNLWRQHLSAPTFISTQVEQRGCCNGYLSWPRPWYNVVIVSQNFL